MIFTAIENKLTQAMFIKTVYHYQILEKASKSIKVGEMDKSWRELTDMFQICVK